MVLQLGHSVTASSNGVLKLLLGLPFVLAQILAFQLIFPPASVTFASLWREARSGLGFEVLRRRYCPNSLNLGISILYLVGVFFFIWSFHSTDIDDKSRVVLQQVPIALPMSLLSLFHLWSFLPEGASWGVLYALLVPPMVVLLYLAASIVAFLLGPLWRVHVHIFMAERVRVLRICSWFLRRTKAGAT